jgi:CheY-like chemotaxis protein
VSLAARMSDGHDAFERAVGDANASEAADTTATPAAGLAILVAEDNEINALLTEALLKRLGHRPTVVPHGEAALTAWLNAGAGGAPFDLALMDLHMPGGDGIAAARAIRAAEAEHGTKRMPIIALTANAMEDDREACDAAGMDGFLTKPLDRERLAATLLELTALRSLAA